MVVEAVDASLSGKLPIEEAMAEYEQRRNEAALPLYEFTCQVATRCIETLHLRARLPWY